MVTGAGGAAVVVVVVGGGIGAGAAVVVLEDVLAVAGRVTCSPSTSTRSAPVGRACRADVDPTVPVTTSITTASTASAASARIVGAGIRRARVDDSRSATSPARIAGVLRRTHPLRTG